MKILFSPVGASDPYTREFDAETQAVSAVHEGPLLQIIRSERPDKIYISLTPENRAADAQDHRYLGAVALLRQELGSECSVETVDAPEGDPFDALRGVFTDLLSDTEPDTQLLVNLSSCTPEQRDAVILLASSGSLPLVPVQAAAAAGEPVSDAPLALTEEWALNADSQPDAVSRVSTVKTRNLQYIFGCKLLKELIDAYDYQGAKIAADSMKGSLPQQFTDLLDAAVLRSSGHFADAQMKLRACGQEALTAGIRPAAEYYLRLAQDVKAKRYTEFMRGMPLLLIELLSETILKQFNLDVTQYMGYGTKRWDHSKLMIAQLTGKFKESYTYHTKPKPGNLGVYVTTANLSNLIENLAVPKKDSQLVLDTFKLRQECEEKPRSLAIFTLQTASEQDMEKSLMKTPDELLAMMRDYMRNYTSIALTDEILASYDTMNAKLKSYL